MASSWSFDAGIEVTKLTEKNYLRTLENAVRFGRWVLMENVLETLDASLEPLLLQQTFVQGGTKMIKIGDSTIPCDLRVPFHAIDATRLRQRRRWVASGPNLRPFGPRRDRDRRSSRDAVRTGSNLDQRPPIAFSDGDESRRPPHAAARPPRAEIRLPRTQVERQLQILHDVEPAEPALRAGSLCEGVSLKFRHHARRVGRSAPRCCGCGRKTGHGREEEQPRAFCGVPATRGHRTRPGVVF